ncbi:hypothetical protein AB0J80_19940 [Actinoplanes sp. NPDC049548]|uniref:hypothetical protein n=1 Tax=Actinoplanes sp. NPDC049548 TaxID=3155152 RepID=UPI003435C94F
MPEQVNGRHRATGRGRYLSLRLAIPRHAAADPTAVAQPRASRWPWAIVVAAFVALGATVPLLLHDPGTPQAAVPLPAVSIPPPPTAAATPSATRRPLRAVAQARKISPSATPSASRSTKAAPVLLGPADDAGLPQLLNDYCRANVGRFTLAVSTPDGWACGRLARDPVRIDMDAMCRWRYGDAAWADLPDGAATTGWRCYRDGP